MAMTTDRIMSIGILIAIIFLSLLLESYSMAIEKEIFDMNDLMKKELIPNDKKFI
jgi:hypothetical protein